MANNDYVIGITPPSDTTKKWLDISGKIPMQKRYDETTGAWVSVLSTVANAKAPIENILQQEIEDHINQKESHIIICTKNTRPLTAKIGQHISEIDGSDYKNAGTINSPIWKSIGSVSNANEIQYNNTAYPSITNIEQALNKLLYIPPQITSFSNNINIVEMGSVINSVTLNWNINKNDIVSQSLTDVLSLNITDRTITLNNLNLNNNKTYTLAINDGTNVVTVNTTISFLFKRYWGVSSNAELTNQDILNLNSEFATSKNTSKTFDCSGGKYIYLAFPSSFGDVILKSGGLTSAFNKYTITNFLNSSGGTTSYNVYRSTNLLNGNSITIDVS